MYIALQLLIVGPLKTGLSIRSIKGGYTYSIYGAGMYTSEWGTQYSTPSYFETCSTILKTRTELLVLAINCRGYNTTIYPTAVQHSTVLLFLHIHVHTGRLAALSVLLCQLSNIPPWSPLLTIR